MKKSTINTQSLIYNYVLGYEIENKTVKPNANEKPIKPHFNLPLPTDCISEECSGPYAITLFKMEPKLL